MLTRFKALGVAALVACAAVPAVAQTTPIPRLNCTSANFPSCGWGYRGNNSHYTLTQVGNGARFTLNPGSASGMTQFYMGWGQSVPQAQTGDSRYIRLRMRVYGPVNPAGVGDIWTDKFIILGDGGQSGRVIVELRPSGDGLSTRIQQNIAGDEARTPLVSIPNDQLVSLQYEARSGSSGRVAVWRNNNSYGSPTGTSPNFNLSAQAWNNINLGYYSNASLASNGRVIFEVTDVEYDDQFDASWHSGGGGSTATPPATPTNVRVVAASMSGLLPIGLLTSLLLLRRKSAARTH